MQRALSMPKAYASLAAGRSTSSAVFSTSCVLSMVNMEPAGTFALCSIPQRVLDHRLGASAVTGVKIPGVSEFFSFHRVRAADFPDSNRYGKFRT
jgi:hypothetical protein